MERIARIPVEFSGELYEFKLYARTLLVLGDKLRVEYTEKICDQVICTFFDEYRKEEIEAGMLQQAKEYKARVLKSIASWEAQQAEGAQNE